MRLWNHLRQQLLKYKEQVLCEGSKQISFGSLLKTTEEFAKQLEGALCCAVFCDSEYMAAQAILICFAAGVTALPLSKRYGEEHCKKILDKIRPDGILYDTEDGLVFKRLSHHAYMAPKVHPALILCTSGTTGEPKGAMLTEDNILCNLEDIAMYFDITEQDRILIARPLYHGAVLVGEFLTALCKGTKLYFNSGMFSPARTVSLLERYKISVFCGTPTLLLLMSRFLRKEHGKTLKRIVVSGECMSVETGRRIAAAFQDAKIYHVYGLTEASPRLSYLPPELFSKHPDFVGYPLRSVKMRVKRVDGSLAAEGERGVLFACGENIMAGYYGDVEKTAAVLQDGWLNTGDIASFQENGLLKIHGRADDLIIKAGMNIYPQEIEGMLKRDNRVAEALAYGYPTEFGTQIGLKIAGDFHSVSQVRQLCVNCLAPYQMPAKIELVSHLEKNASGKIKRGENNVGI